MKSTTDRAKTSNVTLDTTPGEARGGRARHPDPTRHATESLAVQSSCAALIASGPREATETAELDDSRACRASDRVLRKSRNGALHGETFRRDAPRIAGIEQRGQAAAPARSRAASRPGGSPKCRRYSRLNCDVLS